MWIWDFPQTLRKSLWLNSWAQSITRDYSAHPKQNNKRPEVEYVTNLKASGFNPSIVWLSVRVAYSPMSFTTENVFFFCLFSLGWQMAISYQSAEDFPSATSLFMSRASLELDSINTCASFYPHGLVYECVYKANPRHATWQDFKLYHPKWKLLYQVYEASIDQKKIWL